MTSAAQVVKDFSIKPYTLWDLKGKDFTIIENLPKTQDVRETKEISEKTGKQYKVFFIKIEHGLFQKDLKLFESELEALFLAIPAFVTNFAGTNISVDKFDTKTLKFVSQTTQDINGNRLGTNTPATGQSAPISQPRVWM